MDYEEQHRQHFSPQGSPSYDIFWGVAARNAFRILSRASDAVPQLFGTWRRLCIFIFGFFSAIAERLYGGAAYVIPPPDDADFARITRHFRDSGILASLVPLTSFNDEIKLFGFGGRIGDIVGGSRITFGGAGFTRRDAMARALGEAAERAAFAAIPSRGVLRLSIADAAENSNALDPFSVAGIASDQRLLPGFERYRLDRSAILGWVYAREAIKGIDVLVPAQLIFWRYASETGEPFIRPPISTGNAVAAEFDEAFYRGICEVVERDAIAIFWLNKLVPPRVDLSRIQDDHIRYFLARAARYRVEAHTCDITTDTGMPTFISILVDRTGKGPAIAVGAKTDLDRIAAVKGSLLEAQKSRIRSRVLSEGNGDEKDERALYWSRLEALAHIEFMFGGPIAESIEPGSGSPQSAGQKLRRALKIFAGRREPVYCYERKMRSINRAGFRAVGVLIPDLQPIWKDEAHPCLGGKRLREVPELLGHRPAENFYSIPHPFC